MKLRGIAGLEGASKLDRAMWEEYHVNPAELVPLGQACFDALFVSDEHETVEVIPGKGIRTRRRPPVGETEITALTKQRRGQDYFRDIVLNNYDNRCGITGLPVRELLIASHILPWRDHEAERLNVSNGICLNRLHDAAFDQGLIGFDAGFCVILAPKLRSYLPREAILSQFEAYDKVSLSLPEDGIRPKQAFLSEHRKRFGLA